MAVLIIDFDDAGHFPRRSFRLLVGNDAEVVNFEISFGPLPLLTVHEELKIVFFPRRPEGPYSFSRRLEEHFRRRLA